MTLDQITRVGINPAMKLLPELMDSPRARVQLLAIGLQESRFEHRFQVLNGTTAKGPARSFWQFERGGGCKGVIQHELSKPHMRRVCEARGIAFTASTLWIAMETDDVAAAAAARLLLWTDLQRLPELGDEKGAWALYLRTWRPGKPQPDTWPAFYRQAMDFNLKVA
jgi:hypothetical protein